MGRNHFLILNPKEERRKVFPFNSLEFLETWKLWKQYRMATHKFEYKTAVSEQGALKILLDASGGQEDASIKLIHYAIGRQWMSFFKSKNNTNGSEKVDHEELQAELRAAGYGKQTS